MKPLRLIIAALIMLSGVLPLLGQQAAPTDVLAYFDEHKRWYNGFTEAWFQFFDIPEDDVRKSIAHWEQIGNDLKNSENEIAGTYASGGDTHGDYLRWSAKNGFVWLNVNKCVGGPMRITRGRVQIVPEGVIFVPETTLGNAEGHGVHSKHSSRIEMISIKWMGTHHLVQKKNLSNFADYTAGLGEFNGYPSFMLGSPFLMKMGTGDDTENPKFELPEFPAGYEHFLKRPVRGKIRHIAKSIRIVNKDSEDYDDLVTKLQIELMPGSAAIPDLQLFAVGTEQNFAEKFLVKSVKKNIATVEHTRWISKKNCVLTEHDDCKDIDHVKLQNGLILSTNGF